jgi:hypothetical protein
MRSAAEVSDAEVAARLKVDRWPYPVDVAFDLRCYDGPTRRSPGDCENPNNDQDVRRIEKALERLVEMGVARRGKVFVDQPYRYAFRELTGEALRLFESLQAYHRKSAARKVRRVMRIEEAVYEREHGDEGSITPPAGTPRAAVPFVKEAS